MKDYFKKLWEHIVEMLSGTVFPFGMFFFSLGVIIGSLSTDWKPGWKELYWAFIAIFWVLIFVQNKFHHDKGRAAEQ